MSKQRDDYVWIRKSGEQQEDAAQVSNVKLMLTKREVKTPRDTHWLVVTKGRRKVHNTPEFKKLRSLIEKDKVGTVWIESQDRLGLGAKDTGDLFEFTKLCRQHSTKVIDLTDDEDLTTDDFQTNLMTLLRNDKSKRELSDKARRSLRSRVNNFVQQPKTSWPTGPQPFGYAKRCFAADGQTMLWEWQPVSRTEGVAFDFDADGKLRKRNGRVEKLPRKDKRDIIVLVPHQNAKFVKAVQLVFEYYVKLNISRRKISARLNEQGYTFYNNKFSHSYVTQILTNPAYVGDIHFGKVKAGELYSFDGDGTLTKLEDTNGNPKPNKRPNSERLIKQNTHEPLIDRDTWDKAQRKLDGETAQREGQNITYAPRNPNYYLKPVLVCGHCGKHMVGRTDSRTKVVTYVCSSYITGRCNGHDVDCGYHSIKHEDAERMLLDKLEEVGAKLDVASVSAGSDSLFQKIDLLHDTDSEKRHDLIEEAVATVVSTIEQTVHMTKALKRKLAVATRRLFRFGGKSVNRKEPVKGFVKLVKEIETKSVQAAHTELERIQEQLTSVTKSWALADDDDKPILQDQKQELKVELAKWQQRTLTITERLKQTKVGTASEWEQLRKDLKGIPMEQRAKGEAFARLFGNGVTLYWERQFHPAVHNPSRPKKTQREGRYSYNLLTEKTDWGSVTNLVGSW